MDLDKNIKYDHLQELGGSNYEIVDGEPNIKGWKVRNHEGRKIGKVDELLFDPVSQKVRYLVVDLDASELGLEDDRKVLVPIGVASIHDKKKYDNDVEDRDDDDNGDKVRLAGDDVLDSPYQNSRFNPHNERHLVSVPVDINQLRTLPAYKKHYVSPEVESAVMRVFQGVDNTAPYTYDSDFYKHEHFNEDRFYQSPIEGANVRGTEKIPVIEESLEIGKEAVETGRARIRTRIIEKPVEGKLDVREEHVNVERTPVNRPVSSDDTNLFKEGEIEIREFAEVPVVKKEARVVEEVSLNKEVKEKEETIRETLRSTEVDTERINRDKKKR